MNQEELELVSSGEIETAKESKETASNEEAQAGEWYVIHTYAGHENKVQANLFKRIETLGMKDKIFEVIIPVEEQFEFKGGKRVKVEKKIYPGYLLVRMILTDDSWYVVRNTLGVTGFVGTTGSGGKPVPLSKEEVEHILNPEKSGAVRYKEIYKEGDPVEITSGPFAKFRGKIKEVYPEKAKVKVLITIFGRETPVEIEYGQIEKI